MYVVPDSHIVVQPLVRPVERAMSLRDYQQLQRLLQREKQAKEDELRHQLKKQYASQEHKRLELALYRLAYLQARERQQREEQIQHAIQAYRQKELIRAVEEQVYRQKLAEALEQRQNELLRQHFLQQMRAKLAQRRQESPRPVVSPHQPTCFEDYKNKHMCHVLRHVFGEEPEEMEIKEDDGDPNWMDENENEEDLNESLWDRLTMVDEDESDKEEQSAGAITPPEAEQHAAMTGKIEFPPRKTQIPAVPEEQTITQKTLPTAYEISLKQPDTQIDELSQEQYDQALENLLKNLVRKSSDEKDKAIALEQPLPTTGFVPKDIVTEAEPTPANEATYESLGMDMSANTEDLISTQVDESVKQTQLDKLSAIEQKLAELETKHARQPLGPLTFDKTKHKTLPATTKANKEFLQREEELVQLLLQLDTVDSLGLNDIRQRRKQAVTAAEKLLQDLDDYKFSN